MDRLKLFGGNSNPELTAKICQHLQIPQGKAVVQTFSDGEIMVEIGENVRGRDVFVMQSTCSPVNHNLMELLVLMDALKRASAWRITAVLPYYGYARQDTKVLPRVPISAKLVADLITVAGGHRVICLDLHANQIQGFFDIPVDNLFAAPVLLEYIRQYFNGELVVVSPDAGGVERARAFAKRLHASLAIIDKRRDEDQKVKAMHIVGEVEGKAAIILDDMVDTGGTLTEAAKALAENGALSINACCTHAVLSGNAIGRIEESAIENLIVTDSIPLQPETKGCKKIKVLTVANLLGEAIKRTHLNDSVSSLFV
ncbi:MAG: ribose-phosphate pyrophosphokinase [Deltaproteobacteria bacterium]|nr:ribose-phosphate pyrophosphokinase [Deltaproteobacteria bacterium]MDH3773746.1 ribose-phosphate pyrophosphokinase [Deltaproteobacteria bacterium]MDH3802134.1 ribose-phosphate pyrophosphokinase [Deltaproteobacteria bacterium]MDH3852318.1 ribose-phosphate pyrophosphokinase [Deltaproteobacteria bacterium]MDH3898880.1 ribose-phosphate pyrophosphokinase [Deltaproteobacteria bacterium]